MSDLIRAANDIANYVNDPNDASRKLAEASLERNVGTSKQDLENLAKVFVGTGTLPQLAVMEEEGHRFSPEDGQFTKEQLSNIAGDTEKQGLTRLAALMSSNWFDQINHSTDSTEPGLGSAMGNTWKSWTDHTVDLNEMKTFASQSQAQQLKDGTGFGENRRVDPKYSTNVEYDKSLDQNTLLGVVGDSTQSPGQRLQAAYALHQQGHNEITLPDGTNGDIKVKISTDSHGNIGLFANEGGKPFVLMRGVYRNGTVSQQAGVGYFGDKWQRLHPGTVFTP